MLPKIRITSKKPSYKSYSALNFVPKVPEGISLSPLRVELRVSKDLYVVEILHLQKRQITFPLRLNALENTHQNQKTFK